MNKKLGLLAFNENVRFRNYATAFDDLYRHLIDSIDPLDARRILDKFGEISTHENIGAKTDVL